MKESLIYFCNAIIEEDSISLYTSIADFFQRFNYTDGYINTLQAIYDTSGDSSYLIKIGDLLHENGQNDFAFFCYSKYLKDKNPYLYKKLDSAKPEFFYYNDSRAQFSTEPTLIKLINKNVLLTHLTNLALIYNLIDIVPELINKINIIKDQINIYIKFPGKKFEIKINDINDIVEVIDDYRFLSDALSNIKHHNDLNKLAITLNKKNRLAYLNILDDYIVYDNKQNAIEFYNSAFCSEFDVESVSNYEQLYIIMNKFYLEIGDYYKAVYYQKLIIEEGLKI